jgi:hypothetical protein
MSDKIKDGGPAFPRNGHPDKNDFPMDGMSLRDYFAAKAMSRIPFGEYETGKVAKIAYDTADAMLEARKK